MNTQQPAPAETIATALSQLRRPRGLGQELRDELRKGHEGHPGRRGPGDPHHPHDHHGGDTPPHGRGFGRAGGRGGGRAGGMALGRLLETLSVSATPMSVSDLGEAIGVDQPRASRLVQQAAEHGMVEREADPEDARRTRIVLTAQGREFVKRVTGERREALDRALTALDGPEQEELARLLSKLAANWQA